MPAMVAPIELASGLTVVVPRMVLTLTVVLLASDAVVAVSASFVVTVLIRLAMISSLLKVACCQLAPPSAVATYGNPSNAAYYKSAYWFVITNSPPVKTTSVTITRVAYTQPTTYGELPQLTTITNYTINNFYIGITCCKSGFSINSLW